MKQPDQHRHDLCISYAPADHAWVEGYLLDALRQTALRCHLEPLPADEQAITPAPLRALEQAIATSQHTLLVLSSSYGAATIAELPSLLLQRYGADTSKWPVTLLTLSPVELPPRLTMLTHLDATSPEQWPGTIERLCTTLECSPPGTSPPPPCPYPGVVPFAESDSHRFFGRDQEVHEILEHMRGYPFLALIGPSGSGKSSLVFAGLLPELRRVNTRLLPSGSGAWLVRTLRPGEAPLAALGSALGGQNPATPARAVSALQARYPGTRRLLLVIDQFEELFTLAPHETHTFQQAVLHLLAMSKRGELPLHVYVMVVLRADFYSNLMESPLWDEVRDHRLEVMPLSGERLHAAIVQPASDVGVCIEPALVQRLSEEATSEPSALPLLQETLIMLWDRLQRRFLPLHAYIEALMERGIKGGAALTPHNGGRSTGLQIALAHHAETVFKALNPQQQAIARRLMLQLVRIGSGHLDTCCQQSVVALRSAADNPLLFEQTLRHLTEQRLVTVIAEGDDAHATVITEGEAGIGGERDMRTRDFIESSPRSEGYRARTVFITHEVLVSGWPRLRQWLAERRAALQTKQRLDEKATQWVRMGSSTIGLLDATELQEAEQWLRSPEAAEIGYHEALQRLVQASQQEARKGAQPEDQPARNEPEPITPPLLPATAGDTAESKPAATPTTRATSTMQPASSKPRRSMRRVLLAIVVVLLALLTGGVVSGWIPVPQRAWNWSPLQQAGRETPASEAHSQPVITETTETVTDTHATRTDQQLHTVIARQLAAQALDQRDTRPDLGLLLSVEANRQLAEPASQDDVTHQLATAEARSSLLTLLQSNPTLIKFLRSHTSIVSSLTFSPDGQMLASGSCAGSTQIGAAGSTTDDSSAVARSARTTCSMGEVHLWQVAHGAASHTASFQGHTDGVTSLAFSPDSNLLASGSGDNTIILWDVERGEQRDLALQGHTDAVVSLDFNQDGTLLASASWDETVILWDVASGQPLGQPLRGHTNSVNTIAFSPDGARLASGSWDGSIIVWDVASRAPVGEPLQGHAFAVGSVAFSPDGSMLVSGGIDAAVVVWDVASGSSVMISAPVNPEAPASEVVTGHATSVYSVAFNPNNRMVASVSEDGTVLLWEISRNAENAGIATRLQRAFTIPTLHDYANAETIVPPIMNLAFSPDSAMLATSSGGNAVLLWDVTTPPDQQFSTLGTSLSDTYAGDQRSLSPLCVAFSPDGSTIATGNADNSIVLWNTAPIPEGAAALTATTAVTHTMPHLLQGHTDSVTSVAFSPDGSMLASSSLDDTIIVWDMEGQRTAAAVGAPPAAAPIGPPLEGHVEAVTSIAFSPDGSLLASAGMDGSVLLWDLQSGQPRNPPLQGHAFAVHSVAFSPDGSILASAGKDTTIILWDAATSQPLGSPLEGHTDEVHALAFSPDGSILASRSVDDGIILWDVETRQGTPLYMSAGRPMRKERLGSEGHLPMSLTFSPDGRMLATGSSDGTLLVWDVAASQLIGTFQAGSATEDDTLLFVNAAFQPQAMLLASTSFRMSNRSDALPVPGDNTTQGRVIVWDTSIESWQERACAIANRNLTRQEWERFIGLDQEYRQTCE